MENVEVPLSDHEQLSAQRRGKKWERRWALPIGSRSTAPVLKLKRIENRLRFERFAIGRLINILPNVDNCNSNSHFVVDHTHFVNHDEVFQTYNLFL
jgi:hypothetical protein